MTVIITGAAIITVELVGRLCFGWFEYHDSAQDHTPRLMSAGYPVTS